MIERSHKFIGTLDFPTRKGRKAEKAIFAILTPSVATELVICNLFDLPPQTSLFGFDPALPKYFHGLGGLLLTI